MDYLEKLLKDNENLWQPPAGAAHTESAAANREREADMPLSERLLPALAYRGALRRARQAQHKAQIARVSQQQAQLAHMAQAQALHMRAQVRTEERGNPTGNLGMETAQTVFLPSELSYEDISRFFERDARRYG